MNTISLASRLASARLANRQGAALLDSFAVVAFAVSSFLTLTTVGGFAMFVNRKDTIDAIMAENLGIDPQITMSAGVSYVIFASIALALLIVPLFTLGTGAARLGAQGRSKRLASLRLVGMTAGQVQRLALVETLVQYVVGFLIGFVLYLVTAPAWHALSFEAVPIGVTEMILPWWGMLAVFLVLGGLAAASTLLGLVQVSISPLGVARRMNAGSVKMWRLVLLVVVAIVVFVVFSKFTDTQTMDEVLRVLIPGAIAVGILALAFNIAGPLFVQILARTRLGSKSATSLLAARRIVDDPRAAWRNIGGVVLMGFVAAAATSLSVFSISDTVTVGMNVPLGQDIDTFNRAMAVDVVKGVMVAFAFSLIIGAVSTMIQQASDVFDRAGEEKALVQMGAPMKTFYGTRLKQVMWPFGVTMILAVLVGALPGMAFQQGDKSNMIVLAVMVLLGVVITLVPVLLTRPIERRVLLSQARRND